MRARVKQSHPIGTTTACGGIQFSKREWTAVPAHEEAAALRDPALEIEPVPEVPAVDDAAEAIAEGEQIGGFMSEGETELEAATEPVMPEEQPDTEYESAPAPKRRGKKS